MKAVTHPPGALTLTRLLPCSSDTTPDIAGIPLTGCFTMTSLPWSASGDKLSRAQAVLVGGAGAMWGILGRAGWGVEGRFTSTGSPLAPMDVSSPAPS